MAYPFAPITLTASTTLDRDTHANGPVIVLSAAAGLTATLPASTGGGDEYFFFVGTSVTSNADIVAAAGTDVIAGIADVVTDIGGVVIPTSATSDYVTMNGGTTGGIKGSWVKMVDAVSGTWSVTARLISTGAEATPFAAT